MQDGSLPLFSKVKANIEMFPVMNLEDCRRGSNSSAEARSDQLELTGKWS